MDNSIYKLGDKVEVIGNTKHGHSFKVGDIGEVIKVYTNGADLEVRRDRCPQTLHIRDVKLYCSTNIDEIPDQNSLHPFQVGDVIKTKTSIKVWAFPSDKIKSKEDWKRDNGPYSPNKYKVVKLYEQNGIPCMKLNHKSRGDMDTQWNPYAFELVKKKGTKKGTKKKENLLDFYY